MLHHKLFLSKSYFHRNGVRFDYALKKWINVIDCFVSKVRQTKFGKIEPSEFLVIAIEVPAPIVVENKNRGWPTQAEYDLIEDVKSCV